MATQLSLCSTSTVPRARRWALLSEAARVESVRHWLFFSSSCARACVINVPSGSCHRVSLWSVIVSVWSVPWTLQGLFSERERKLESCEQMRIDVSVSEKKACVCSCTLNCAVLHSWRSALGAQFRSMLSPRDELTQFRVRSGSTPPHQSRLSWPPDLDTLLLSLDSDGCIRNCVLCVQVALASGQPLYVQYSPWTTRWPSKMFQLKRIPGYRIPTYFPYRRHPELIRLHSTSCMTVNTFLCAILTPVIRTLLFWD